MFYHQTKFGYKRFRSSEHIVRTNFIGILNRFRDLDPRHSTHHIIPSDHFFSRTYNHKHGWRKADNNNSNDSEHDTYSYKHYRHKNDYNNSNDNEHNTYSYKPYRDKDDNNTK